MSDTLEQHYPIGTNEMEKHEIITLALMRRLSKFSVFENKILETAARGKNILTMQTLCQICLFKLLKMTQILLYFKWK